MNPILPTDPAPPQDAQEAAEGQTAAPASEAASADDPPTKADDGQYEAATGFDRKSVEMKKEIEGQVYDKVMSDLNHVVWAYGVIFALFAVYGVFLLRKSAALRDDLDALKGELDKRS